MKSDNKTGHDNRQTTIRALLIALNSLLFIVVIGLGYFNYQQTASYNQASLQNQKLVSQNAKLAQNLKFVQAQGNIDTSSWKTYCDSFDKYCFKYPPNWQERDSVGDVGASFKIVSADVFSP